MLEIRAVTPHGWAGLARLFTRRGAPHYCWCSVWRDLTTAQRRDPGAKPAGLRRRARRGEHVGLLACDNGEPVAWCSVGPRESDRALGGPAGKRRHVMRRRLPGV